VRYEVLAEIGSGGMASVQYGRLHASHGFVRSVAIKRLHAQFAKDPDFVRMFIDEARVSARLLHANIVATLDVIDAPGELSLVMEYVHGESLWSLLLLAVQYGKPVPIRVATALIAAVLHGLHAAHTTAGEQNEPLGIVHRDVSPHNILVGGDGIARIIDFGIAKAVGRLHATPSGQIKGKLMYMAPEQLTAGEIDGRADVYGAAAVLWETLTGRQLFDGPNESTIIHDVLLGTIEPPGKLRREVTRALDDIVMRALRREPSERFDNARDMALALERDVGIASQSELADWLHDLAGGRLAERSRLIASLHEQSSAQAANRSSTTHYEAPELEAQARSSVAGDTDGSVLRRREPERRFSRVWLAVAALFCVAIALWFRSRPQLVAQRVARALPASAQIEQPAAAPNTSTEAASDPELPRGLSAPAAEPEPTRPEPEASKPAPPSAAPKKPKPAAASNPQCRPWFYIDESGIRRPKPGCL
jgi:serine/threonine-protein kinase